MKKTVTVLIGICCLLASLDSHSGILGDVNDDGRIGLPEAINALQVTSGMRTAQSFYTISWKGAWGTGQTYQVYDVVQFNGSSHICLQNHTSTVSNQPPSATVWDPIALKGADGPQGPKGDTGPQGPLNPNVNISMDNRNTAAGIDTLVSTTTGGANTAMGWSALSQNSSGSYNTALGDSSLMNNTTGYGNVATGYVALRSNTTGYNNAAMGDSALFSNTTGDGNVAIGEAALFSNATGASNIAIGEYALFYHTSGNSNIAIGHQAGNLVTSGSNNIIIGSEGFYIGPNIRLPMENTILIGGNQTATYISGIYGKTTSSGAPVYVNSSGKLGTVTSSRRYKEEIKDMGDSSNDIMKLRPVAFFYKPEYSDGQRTLQYGLIAEEVAAIYPDLVQYDPKTGEAQTVYYHLVNAMLLNEVQKQQRHINELEERVSKLEVLLKK